MGKNISIGSKLTANDFNSHFLIESFLANAKFLLSLDKTVFGLVCRLISIRVCVFSLHDFHVLLLT